MIPNMFQANVMCEYLQQNFVISILPPINTQSKKEYSEQNEYF